LVPPRVVIAVPSGITAVEKRAVKDSAIRAGAREVLLLGEPMAASIGAGLPIHDEYANMIVDIGGGTTEVAIISISGVSFQRSIRVGGDELDDAIIKYMKDGHKLLIGVRTAEEIKFTIGSAAPLSGGELTIDVRGRDATAGLPVTKHITSQEIREEALKEVVTQIVDLVKNALDRCQPEHSADLIDRGIVLAGGGALIRGLDQVISDATGLPVIKAEDPLCCVANGTGEFLNLLGTLTREQVDRLVTQ
jgi:rod shape-determining protein MreB